MILKPRFPSFQGLLSTSLGLRVSTVFVLLFGIGLVFTFPLVLYMSQGFPVRVTDMPEELGKVYHRLIVGDHIQFYYYLWLFYDHLMNHTPLFKNPYEFSVPGYPDSFVTYFFPLSLIFFLFSGFGTIFSYNLLVILSFPLAGIALYLLAELSMEGGPGGSGSQKNIGPVFAAGMVGSFVFTLYPYRMESVISGHPTGFVFFLVPLLFYFLELSFRRGSILYSACAGMCLVCMFLTELHFLYFSSLWSLVYIGFRVLAFPEPGEWKSRRTVFWGPLRRFRFAVPYLVLAGMVVLLQMYVNEKYLALSKSKVGEGRSAVEVQAFSPEPADLLIRYNDNTSKYVYPGVIPPLLLLGLAAVVLRKRKALVRDPRFRFGLFYLGSGAFFLLVMFGPNLHAVPLYDLLSRALPRFNIIRQFAKVGVFSMMSLSLLSGFMVFLLGQRLRPRWFYPLAVFLLAGIMLDFHTVRNLKISIPPSHVEIDDLVRNGVEGRTVLHLPLWPGDSAWSSKYQYFITRTRARMVNGYFPLVNREYFSDVFSVLEPMNLGVVGQGRYRLLRELGVKYVLLHADAFPGKVSPFPYWHSVDLLSRSPYLHLLRKDPVLFLFEVVDPAQVKDSESGTARGGSGEAGRTPIPPAPVGNLMEGEDMPRHVGAGLPNLRASDGCTIGVDLFNDRKDFLAYGKYNFLPPGKYSVTFRFLNRSAGTEPVADLSVVRDAGKKILWEKTIYPSSDPNPAGFEEVEVPLEFPDVVFDLEPRAMVYPNRNFELDYVYLKPAEVPDSPDTLRITDLYRSPFLLPNKGVYVVDPQLALWELFKGPHLRYSAGRYRWTVRMRMDSVEKIPGGDPVAAIMQVYTGMERAVLLNREVRVSELETPGPTGPAGKSGSGNSFPPVTLEFDLPLDEVIGFKIFYSGSAVLEIKDEMRVERIDQTPNR